MDLSTLSLAEEERNELKLEFEYYSNFGIEIKKLNETPRPLGTIKEMLFDLHINKDEIDIIYMMSYDISKTLAYINKDHSSDEFKIVIYGYKDSLDVNDSYDEKRITIFPSTTRQTEHFNLIKLKKEKVVKTITQNNKEVNKKTAFLLFIEPFHDGDSFGPAYEQASDEEITDYKKASLDLLKAKLVIPNDATVKDLLTKFNTAV